MNETAPVHGACHCGTIRFTARLTDGLADPRRCNCSLCRMRGAVVVTARHEDVAVTAGAEHLTLYQFNTGVAEHYFCARCGIYPFHRRRSNPDEMGVNVACLDGVSPFDFAQVPVYEGRTHPSDSGDGRFYAIAGDLLYRDRPRGE